MTGSDDGDSSGIFDRPISTLADGGTALGDFRRALTYPATMSTGTAIKGSLLFFSTLFVLPIPLLYGYVLRVAEAIRNDEPAPEFDDIGRDYLRGLGLGVVATALLFGPVFALAFVLALLGQTNNEAASEAVAPFIVLWWAYAVPWAVGVYGVGSWRSFLDDTAWRWAVSVNYLVTYLLVAAVLIVGYFVFAVSVITIIGWTFVGFVITVLLGAIVGQRYGTYLDARGITVEERSADESEQSTTAAAAGTATGANVSDGGATDETGTDATGGTDATDTGTASASAGGRGGAADDPEREDYERLRERARRVERRGPIERLEAGDGGRIGYLSVADDYDGAETADAFGRTVEQWNGISHNPSVATVFGTGEEPTPWVAFDPLDGPLTAVGGDLSGPEVVAVTESVADAISTGRMYNIAHREISPHCVYVERGGGTAAASQRISATVADWGLCHELLATTGADGRAIRYLAPEQFGGGAANPLVDVYQLAAVAHYALLGEPPFASVDDEELTAADRAVEWSPPEGAGLSEEAVGTFERALATDPETRPDGTDAFVRALRSTLG